MSAAPSRRFIGRHVSMLKAMLAHGFDAGTAAQLVAAARRANTNEVVALDPEDSTRRRTLVFVRQRGNHADVFEVTAKDRS